MHRYGLRDDQWDRIKDLLPGREGSVGARAADNRLFVEAVLYRYRAGIPWRDLPERFGEGLLGLEHQREMLGAGAARGGHVDVRIGAVGDHRIGEIDASLLALAAVTGLTSRLYASPETPE